MRKPGHHDGFACIFALPNVILNDDALTLDDMTVADMEKATGAKIAVVSCNPLGYLQEFINLASPS